MRARRMKKLTQSQLAKEISESEAAIRMAEQGSLPEDDYRLVNKLENFLGIKIVRPEFTNEVSPSKIHGRLSFSKDEAKILTIDDLRRMKEEPEFEEEMEEVKEKDKVNLMDKVEDMKLDAELDRGEISKEEMDRILFGK